jgi:hypothetical protein
MLFVASAWKTFPFRDKKVLNHSPKALKNLGIRLERLYTHGQHESFYLRRAQPDQIFFLPFFREGIKILLI